MAKKSSVTASTNKIAGISGKGAYKYSEMSGSKCMSKTSAGFKTTGPKMSSAHGTNGESKDHNMGHNTGGYLIGKGTRTFKHEAYPTAGPCKPYPKHADQPSGHKTKA